MSALIRSELIRLQTTRATWGLLAVALVLTVAWEAAILAGVGQIGAPGQATVELRDALLGATGVGLFPVLLLGVLAVTGEFHHTTATSTFLITPNRPRVLAAKAIACALAAPPVAVVLLATAWTTGVLAGAIDVTFDPDLLAKAARTMVNAGCWALLGVGVGAAVRNQTIALLLPLLWFLVIETRKPAYGLAWVRPWTPGGAGAAIAGADFPGVQPAWAGFAVVLIYVVALLGPGARAIARRDIA